jgi:hypothetical protein
MRSTLATPARTRQVDHGDLVITLVLLGVMIAAYVGTWSLPRTAAFFPVLLSLTGIGFSLVKLLFLAWAAFGGRAQPAKAVSGHTETFSDGDVSLSAAGDEEQGNEAEFHETFAQMDGRTSAAVIGWMVLFFGGMYIAGFLAIFPVFTVLYLRRAAKASWRVTIVYAGLVTGVIYLVFDRFLHLSLPPGILKLFGS